MKTNCHSLSVALVSSLFILLVSGCQHRMEHCTVFYCHSEGVLPPAEHESLWRDGEFRAYAVGRYVDPHDRNVLHEAHAVYRQEQTSRPNLAPHWMLVLPTRNDFAVTNSAAMFSDALTAELNQQRATSKALIEQAKILDKAIHQLNSKTQEFTDLLMESARVRANLVSVSNRLQFLERSLRSSNADTMTGSTNQPELRR